MSAFVRWLDRELYPNHGRNWDDVLFRARILNCLTPSSLVLDLGAGAGIVEQMNFKGLAARVCGVDLDPRVQQNPMLDEGRVADAGVIPYPDGSFDLVFSDNVMEHISKPEQVFREVLRVLRPGGLFLFKTPNKYHYMPLVARATPTWFHKFVNKRRGRAEVDTFPTLYRVNTVATIGQVASRTGFEVVEIERIEGRPEYLRMTAITYLVGAAYERIVNAIDGLAAFRILLIARLRKPAL